MPIKAIRLRSVFIGIVLIVILIITVSIIIGKTQQRKEQQMENLIQQAKPVFKKEPVYNIVIKSKEIKLEVPSEYNEFNVIGKLEIPKINLTTYIIDTTTKETLNKSVTKLCGPDINKIGNFCITGHNYMNSKMFWKLKKLQIGDEIKLTDLYGQYCIYRVYAIDKVDPNDVSCLQQETQRRKASNTNNMHNRSPTKIGSETRRSI